MGRKLLSLVNVLAKLAFRALALSLSDTCALLNLTVEVNIG